MVQHLYTHIDPINEKHFKKAVETLEKGGLIAYPTDVNWAVGCDPSQSKALKSILKLKPQHPKLKPFTLLCHDLTMVSQVASLNSYAYKVLKKILPGPYTVLLKSHQTLARRIKDKRQIVGVRIPQSSLLLEFIRYYKKPLATSSLGVDKSLFFGYEIEQEFGHGLDLILDLGEGVTPQETSIIDLSEGELVVVRQGIGPTDILI